MAEWPLEEGQVLPGTSWQGQEQGILEGVTLLFEGVVGAVGGPYERRGWGVDDFPEVEDVVNCCAFFSFFSIMLFLVVEIQAWLCKSEIKHRYPP